MEILASTAFLGLLTLFWVISLSGLSASSKMPAQNPRKEVLGSRENVYLLWLAFLSTLVILVWRVS